jgi:hypothetical protein
MPFAYQALNRPGRACPEGHTAQCLGVETPAKGPIMLHRRSLMLASGAALAAPSLATAQTAARTLRFIPQSNLSSMDPVWSTAVIVRNHGLMVYDTLFGLGGDFRAKYQMLAGHEISADGLTWTMTLRPGLRFHDNRGGSVCLNSSWAFPKWFSASVRLPSGLMAAR